MLFQVNKLAKPSDNLLNILYVYRRDPDLVTGSVGCQQIQVPVIDQPSCRGYRHDFHSIFVRQGRIVVVAFDL